MLNSFESVLTPGFSLEEIANAVPKAMNKLAQIIEREGTADGKRLTDEYISQLIAEQITSDRISNYTFERNQKILEQKEKAQRQSAAPTVSIVIVAQTSI